MRGAYTSVIGSAFRARALGVQGILGLCLALPCSLSAQPLLDLGSSPNFVGSGARALGQGNAFIAVADDATAASWNPGGLSQLEKPEISLAVEGFRRRSDTTSTTHPEISSTDTVSLADLNYLSVVYPFRLGARNTVVSLNYLKQYRFDAEGEFDFSLREPIGWGPGWLTYADGKHQFEQEGCFSSLSPAIGIDVTDRLAVGLAVNVWNDDITGDSSFRRSNLEKGLYGISYQGTALTRNVYDTSLEDTYTVDSGTSLTLGALYNISKRWTVGAVAKPPATLHLTHEHEYIDAVTSTGSVDRETDADLQFPWVLGAGLAFRPTDPLTLSADVTWSQWSEYQVEENGEDLNPLSTQSIETDECNDTVSVRLGAEYLVVREGYVVPLRCGVGYDPGPAVDDADRYYSGTLGVGFQRGRYMIDLAYEMRVGQAVNGSSLMSLNATQDAVQHRLLTSLIVYF